MLTDVYFRKSQKIAENLKVDPVVTYNVFIRSDKPIVFAGLDLVIPLIRDFGGQVDLIYSDGEVVPEGTRTLFTYSGYFTDLVTLETQICGLISESCTAATAMRAVVDAAGDTPVVYFGCRHRHPLADDAWCRGAIAGGAIGVASTPTAENLGLLPYGTMPHALCLVMGSTIEAAIAYRKTYSDESLIVLIDTFGRELTDSMELVRHFGPKLYGVRIDTHGRRLCEGCHSSHSFGNYTFGDGVHQILEEMVILHNNINPYKYLFGPGVTVESIYRLRHVLDESGGEHVKIIASSGFTPEKIKVFKAFKAPVDVFGVGLGNPGFQLNATSDIVLVNGKRCHKVGRYEDSYKGDKFLDS